MKTPPLQIGERLGDATVLEIRGEGAKREVRLRCHYPQDDGSECGREVWRPYHSVMDSKRDRAHMACKRCGYTRNRKRAHLWRRQRAAE